MPDELQLLPGEELRVNDPDCCEHPQLDGTLERRNCTLDQELVKHCTDVEICMGQEGSCNAVANEMAKYSPAKLMFESEL